MNDMTFSDVPQAPLPAVKKNNSKVIIIVAVVLVLCCLCLAVIGSLALWGSKGGGPLSMLATDTPTPTRTPTRTPTPTVEISLVGDWTIYFSWDCTGDYNNGDLTFYNDYTYNVNDDSTLWGTWFIVVDYVDFIFDEYPSTHYVGTLSSTGDYMEGTMDNLDEMTGCWYAEK
jgi:hypothetical protein